MADSGLTTCVVPKTSKFYGFIDDRPLNAWDCQAFGRRTLASIGPDSPNDPLSEWCLRKRTSVDVSALATFTAATRIFHHRMTSIIYLTLLPLQRTGHMWMICIEFIR